MMHVRAALLCTPALAFTFILAGCGSNASPGNSATSAPASGPAPMITAVSKQVDGVAPNRKQEVQFSEAMDASTINSKTFQVTDGSGALVSGAVTYDPDFHVASFQPTPAFKSDASYTATIRPA